MSTVLKWQTVVKGIDVHDTSVQTDFGNDAPANSFFWKLLTDIGTKLFVDQPIDPECEAILKKWIAHYGIDPVCTLEQDHASIELFLDETMSTFSEMNKVNARQD
jgi:hypothetical protein